MTDEIRIGHWTDREAATGLTVFIPPQGATVAAEANGQNPGTMNIPALGPVGAVDHADAIVLTGGSMFGLEAAAHLAVELGDRGIGRETPGGNVPVVGAAVVFDLELGGRAKPPADAAVRAYDAARPAIVDGAIAVERGTVGVGTGTVSGVSAGLAHATKGGFGAAARTLRSGASVWAWAVVNSLGDVYGENGRIIAGRRDESGFHSIVDSLADGTAPSVGPGRATTLVVVGTDAELDKRRTWLLARAGHTGIARAISPAAGLGDGDTAFAIATGTHPSVDIIALESVAIEVVAAAIRDAVRRATGLAGLPAASELEFSSAGS